MVDNGSAINIILLQMLLVVGLIVDHLKHTSTVIYSFDQSEQRRLGKIAVKSCFGEVEDFDEFLVINVDAYFNVLLGIT